MTILIRQATIVAPHSPLNGSIKDILIKDGQIAAIDDHITKDDALTINQPNLHISIGWMELFSHFCDPGFEYRETIATGAASAAAGGFTDVALVPNTQPVTQSKAQISYLQQQGSQTAVTIHPLGAVSKNIEGKELAEMYDMQAAGAVAFSDGLNSIQSPAILLKALQYVLPFNGTIVQLPDDRSIQPAGLMNEGVVSTQLGLPGRPAIAEELQIARDIELVKYTGSSIHFTGISTARSVALIAAAKADGLQITCSVTPYHLYFTDEDLRGYDTNLKVNPPLRSLADVVALRKGLSEGIIDCIAIHHLPQHSDTKVCEFEYAKHGMIGLETAYAVLNQIAMEEGFSTGQLIQWLAIAPRQIYQLPIPTLAIGEPAVCTLFDPTQTVSFQKENLHSVSFNSPFLQQPFTGKVIGIINGQHHHFN